MSDTPPMQMPKRPHKPQKSKGDRAYAEAEWRIAKAAAEGATELGLSIDGLDRIPPLDAVPNLQSLYLTGTQVFDLTPLAKLMALQTLGLGRTQVFDLSPLATLTALQSLDLGGTQISDLSLLAKLTALQLLGLGRTQVSDLSPLADLTALQSLNLWGTRVSDLTPLAKLTALRLLYLRQTKVSDLTPLAKLTALQTLNLTRTRVSDLTPLAKLTALQTLNLTRTRVSDLTPLANLTGLMDGTINNPNRFGLSILGIQHLPQPIRTFAGFVNPQRTVKIINYLRAQQGLPPDYPNGYEPDSDDPKPNDPADMGPQPLENVAAPVDFSPTDQGTIAAIAGAGNWPVLRQPTDEKAHAQRLDVCRALAQDLLGALAAKRYNARGDYAEELLSYTNRLPVEPGSGNILLADAAARTIRAMFASDANMLMAGFAAKLKTFLESHIGLRVFYPEIEAFYRDVQQGRIADPLPLDAVEGLKRGIEAFTPSVFEPSVSAAVGSADGAPPPVPAATAEASEPTPNQPMPPPDPLGELDPKKAWFYGLAATVNALWKAFLSGKSVHEAVEAWGKAYHSLAPHIAEFFAWLKAFLSLS